MKKVLYIVGPTASGKTDLAFSLGKDYPSDLVNADSIQVYKGLDIICGKDIPYMTPYVKTSDNFGLDSSYQIGYYLLHNLKLFLLDIVPPSFEFSVHDYLTVAFSVLHEIHKKDRLPIVVGGSGFYIKGLLDGIDTVSIPQNRDLREQLLTTSVSSLQDILREKMPQRLDNMNNSDRNNPRRLVRAIEVAESGKSDKHIISHNRYSNLIIGLHVDKNVLIRNINHRVDARIKAGAVDEAESLFKNYSELNSQVINANGYKSLFSYLKGEVVLEVAIEQWKYSEHQTAKKQMTFFKKDKRIIWYNTQDRHYKALIKKSIEDWYNREER